LRIVDFQSSEAHTLPIKGKALLIGPHLKGGRREGEGENGGREGGREGRKRERTISKGERLVRKAVLALNIF